MKPTIGKIVHYYKKIHEFYPEETKKELKNEPPLAAIITGIVDDNTVHLQVFELTHIYYLYSVDLLNSPDDSKNGYAICPPRI